MNRVTGLLIIEVCHSNPNGDPDQESDPRALPDERGIISPVSFKRKLRDLVELKAGEVWKTIATSFDPNLKDNEFDILESRGRKREEIDAMELDAFLKRYWDARIFGATFLEEKGEQKDSEQSEEKPTSRKSKQQLKEQKIRTGVVQFGLGISISPVEVERCTYSSKPGVQEGKDRGMAPLGFRVVRHGVYLMPYFVNPSAAVKSNCTITDLEVMKLLIPGAYKNTASMLRSDVRIRHAWHIEHKSALGSCPDYLLIEALTPTRLDEANLETPSRNWQEYKVPLDLPAELKSRVAKIEDLVGETRTASA